MTTATDGRLTFAECLCRSLAEAELVAQFDRLTGANLSQRGAPIDLMVDEATGRLEADFVAFVVFVRDCVWDRLPPEIRWEES